MSQTFKFASSVWPTRGDRVWLAQQPLEILQACLTAQHRAANALRKRLDTGLDQPSPMAVKEELELRALLITEIEAQMMLSRQQP